MIELLIFLTGLYVIVSGKIPNLLSTRERTPTGVIYKGALLPPNRARIIGAIYAGIAPLNFFVGFVIGVVGGVAGMEQMTLTVASLGCGIVNLIIGVIIAAQLQNRYYEEVRAQNPPMM